MKRKKIGLALSGGAARGFAHIGVLKVLEENNIPIDLISGTSIGAVIGALYSFQPNAKKLEKDAKTTKFRDLFDFTISKSGFIKGNKLQKFLEKKLENIKFSELKIPLYITAFDIEKNQEIIFHRGYVAKAIRASISIPGIFIPIENNGRVLVDGGVIDPLPIKILKNAGADIIIAVNVDNKKLKNPVNDVAIKKENNKKIPNVLEVMKDTAEVIQTEICENELDNQKVDFLIEPNMKKIKSEDFKKAEKIIRIGEKSAKRSLENLKKATETNSFKIFIEEIQELPLLKEVKKDIKKIEQKF